MRETEVYCVKALVKGLVQGVSYRWSTREQARRLDVTGHALNLADGGVEVLLCGAPSAVEQMLQWLWWGPDMARVISVKVVIVELACPPADFTIG